MSTQDQQYQIQLNEMKLLIERQSAATTKYETDLGSVSQAKQQCAASESNAAASAQSASDDKTSASNSAASAAQSASEASQIAGLDTLASGVGAYHHALIRLILSVRLMTVSN